METAHESQRHSLKVNGCFHRGPSATIQHQTDTENWSTKGKNSLNSRSQFVHFLVTTYVCL